MRLFLDTEFNEYKGQLISIGIVDEDGDEFYAVRYPIEYPTSWVKANVLPVLGTHLEPQRLLDLQASLKDYLSKHDYLSIIVDHPADVKYFCELIDLDKGDVLIEPRISFHIHGSLPTVEKSKVPHNALADARALRANYLEWLGGSICWVSAGHAAGGSLS